MSETLKAELTGGVLDKANMKPPRFADFRMFANLEWLNGGEIIHE